MATELFQGASPVPYVAIIPILILSLTVALGAQAPAGWQVRIDRSTAASDPDDVADVKVATVGSGFRVTGGPAGTFWNPANRAMGDFTARATFRLMKPSGHVNYYGLVFGGEDLAGAKQRYIYFLVAQNGTFIIRHRTGDDVRDVQTRTPHATIAQPGADGSSVNTLEVRVAGNQISYIVNGTTVHTTPRSGETAQTDGIVGVRINHLLDVQVEGFALQP
jgi:hypothetical protein